MDVRLPDGTIIRGVPEGISRADLVARLERNGMQVPAEWKQPAQQAAPEQQPEPQRNPLQQTLGNLGAGAIRGAGSIGSTLLAPFDIAKDALAGKGLSLESNRQRRADITEALQGLGFNTDSTAFGVGKLGGEIAGTAGVPGMLARPLAGAAPALSQAIGSAGMRAGGMTGATGLATRAAGGAIAGGASAGLVDPTDVGAGAAIGAVTPGALQVAGSAGRAVGRALSPNVNNPELARKAIEQYQIPLGPAAISDSRTTKALRSILNDSPFTQGMGAQQQEAVQEGFNRAIGRTFGADAPKLTPDVVDAAKQRMGSEFDRIWGRNSLRVDVDFAQKIQQLKEEAANLPEGEARRLNSWLRDLASKAQATPEGDYIIPGEAANRLQSKLRAEADRASGFLKNDLEELRRSMLAAFNRSVSPEDAAALSANMRQYKAFKTVEPILQKAEVGTAGRDVGNVDSVLLPERVRQQYGSRVAQSPFADLTQIGSQYMTDRVAQTGGSLRAGLQNVGVGGALVGAGMLTNPVVPAAAIGASLGVQRAMGSPALARALLKAQQSPSLLTGPEIAAIQEALARSAPVGLLSD